MKKLPIGIQSFLSRPRRFGKCYYNQAPGRVLLPGIAFPGTETGCMMEMMERGT